MVRCRLSATIADDLWLIALYTAEGDNFYAVAGADLKKANIELVIASADQTVEEAGVDSPESTDEVLVVNSPVNEGIALIRAPLKGPSRAAQCAERTQGQPRAAPIRNQASALKALIRAAVALNTSKRATVRPVSPRKKPKSA